MAQFLMLNQTSATDWCVHRQTHTWPVYTCVQLVFTQKYMTTEVFGVLHPSLPSTVGKSICEHLWEQKVKKKCSGVLVTDVHLQLLLTVNLYFSL